MSFKSSGDVLFYQPKRALPRRQRIYWEKLLKQKHKPNQQSRLHIKVAVA